MVTSPSLDRIGDSGLPSILQNGASGPASIARTSQRITSASIPSSKMCCDKFNQDMLVSMLLIYILEAHYKFFNIT